MTRTRREWLSICLGGAIAARASPSLSASQAPGPGGGGPQTAAEPLKDRIARVVREYGDQGVHRTATDVDARSGDWLAAEVRAAKLEPAREPFDIDRITIARAELIADGGSRTGIPLFDGGFTSGAGVSGRLGALGSDVEIGLADLVPNQAATGALGDARRAGRYKAIVALTRGGRPGLCPSNADQFLYPFGPPVLQLSSEDSAWVTSLALRGPTVHLHAQVARARSSAFNITTTLSGTDRTLPPLVVMTPRSGWWACASERGGGIVCWLELMRTLRTPALRRDVHFVASSGHELGHLGINAYIARRPNFVADAVGWMHLGANLGAATGVGSTIQSSDDEREAILAREMAAASLPVTGRAPRGRIPNGEAEAVHRGGGRYVSVIGRSALFHHPDDRGPEMVDVAALAALVDALSKVARTLAA